MQLGKGCRAELKPGMVESRIGAVAWGLWPTPRFLSPLIELVVPISGIQLSDWLHRKAHGEEAWPQACSAANFHFAFRHSSLGRVLSLMVFYGCGQSPR